MSDTETQVDSLYEGREESQRLLLRLMSEEHGPDMIVCEGGRARMVKFHSMNRLYVYVEKR